jgi:hypothetical protein
VTGSAPAAIDRPAQARCAGMCPCRAGS